MKSKRRKQGGFTLIELIIAIAILVILTGLLAPQFMKYVEQARRAKAIHTLDTVFSTLKIAYTEVPQSVKVGDDNSIAFYGQEPTDENANALYNNVKGNLGETEIKKIDVIIYTTGDGDEAEFLTNVLIRYYPELGTSGGRDTNLFYYMTKSSDFEGDNPSLPADTYGEVRNNTEVTVYR